MGTPLSKIESGIITGDWNLVCEGFNRLTGKNLSPIQPIVKQEVRVFDPSSAKKKEIYTWLKDKMDLGPITSYYLKELREISYIHLMEANTEENTEDPMILDEYVNGTDVAVGRFLDGFRYTSGKNTRMKEDLVKLKAFVDPQLAMVGDPTNKYEPRETPKNIQLKCTKCKKKFNGLAGISVKDELSGEAMGLCAICREII